jgi:sigma-E factor negative regulatory protein RseA
MNERLRESLSALMDDEADDLELGRVLRSMDDGDEVRETWARYHAVRSVLRGDAVSASPAPAVSAAIDDAAEADAPTAAARVSTGVRGWRSFAAAATVTLAVVVGVQWQPAPEDGAAVARAPASEAGAVRPIGGAALPASGGRGAAEPLRLDVPLRAPADPRAFVPVTDAERRVDALMLHHAEINALDSRSGMMPFARYASFEGER